jgi:transcriptional regulator with XRE-family HTH domain
MTEILAQLDLLPASLAWGNPAPRISVMRKKRGPYLRQSPAPAKEPQNQVRAWREHFEMTLEDLADASGLSVASISNYEQGRNEPSIDALGKLSKAFGVPKGMILDVDPAGDPDLWSAFSRATEAQRRDMGRMADALVGPQKPKKK